MFRDKKHNYMNALKKDKNIELLVANKGNYLYYVAFTDELCLSKKWFLDGELIIILGKNSEVNLGPVTYIGEL